MDLIGFFGSFGIWGLAVVLMLETALLPMFFLPGDTLLFTAGYLINAGDLNISHAFILLSISALLGNVIGYMLGVFAEKPLMRFAKKEGSTFNKGIERTRNFYKKYGILTLVFARFIPSVRTIAPFIAGALRMPLGSFVWVSFFSGMFWVAVGLMLGKYFGQRVPNMEHIMVGIVFVAVFVAILPIAWTILKRKFWNKK